MSAREGRSGARVFIGLGTNVGDRIANLRAAVDMLHPDRVSAVYETDPVGPPQPDYLNAVAELHTDESPLDMLARCKRIERDLGRQSTTHWGPRVIDLDLLLYGALIVNDPPLQVPHKFMHERAFVLVPLCDLDPTVNVPGHGTAAALLQRVGRTGVRPYSS